MQEIYSKSTQPQEDITQALDYLMKLKLPRVNKSELDEVPEQVKVFYHDEVLKQLLAFRKAIAHDYSMRHVSYIENPNFELKGKKADVTEAQNRIRNLTAEVEKLTTRRHILQKVAYFKLGLREPMHGQVHHVRHLDSRDSLPVQTLREDIPQETVASRR